MFLTNINVTLVKHCTNGDVKLEKDGTPKFFWNGQWSPICGHYFWNNQFGATSFCKKLGYTKADQHRTNKNYDEDAIRIGQCNKGQSLEECTGGCNDKGLGNGCASCSTGNEVALTITCEGNTPDTFMSSCKGITRITDANVLTIIC
jgi:hypothetical protein